MEQTEKPSNDALELELVLIIAISATGNRYLLLSIPENTVKKASTSLFKIRKFENQIISDFNLTNKTVIALYPIKKI